MLPFTRARCAACAQRPRPITAGCTICHSPNTIVSHECSTAEADHSGLHRRAATPTTPPWCAQRPRPITAGCTVEAERLVGDVLRVLNGRGRSQRAAHTWRATSPALVMASAQRPRPITAGCTNAVHPFTLPEDYSAQRPRPITAGCTQGSWEPAPPQSASVLNGRGRSQRAAQPQLLRRFRVAHVLNGRGRSQRAARG